MGSNQPLSRRFLGFSFRLSPIAYVAWVAGEADYYRGRLSRGYRSSLLKRLDLLLRRDGVERLPLRRFDASSSIPGPWMGPLAVRVSQSFRGIIDAIITDGSLDFCFCGGTSGDDVHGPAFWSRMMVDCSSDVPESSTQGRFQMSKISQI